MQLRSMAMNKYPTIYLVTDMDDRNNYKILPTLKMAKKWVEDESDNAGYPNCFWEEEEDEWIYRYKIYGIAGSWMTAIVFKIAIHDLSEWELLDIEQ